MHYGFRIVEDMIDGLSAYMDDHGFQTIDDFSRPGRAQRRRLGNLDLNYKNCRGYSRRSLHRMPALLRRVRKMARHQCIDSYMVAGNGKKNPNGMGVHVPAIIENECFGCNLCALVCPVDQCITMKQVDPGKPFEKGING